jgi:UDP-N-acetylglucosamine--N-acetylmuramyl-(pentapeptide) pyrophosphoryl-undecaprenol N-acetylglucosamine transferase
VSTAKRVLFAGGGTGGHIYPSIAIAERLHERRPEVEPLFFVSQRPGDAQILNRLGQPFETSPVKPMPPLSRPWRFLPFYVAWRRGLSDARALLQEREITVVVATGGFVSGPALVAATSLGIASVLVNLDAIPGKANRRLSRRGRAVFSVYESAELPGAELVGLPLRRASLGPGDPAEARTALGLDPDLPVLFITGATHGAESVIRAMMILASARPGMFEGWQVFHQCGTFDAGALQAAYEGAGVRARVVPYCDQIGHAWRAASLALSRAGAGSVAEAWGNATPTVFMPNPYHHDQHQRHNAMPMVAAGAAILIADRVDPRANLEPLGDALARLMGNPAELETMRAAAAASKPSDGAEVLARWVSEAL